MMLVEGTTVRHRANGIRLEARIGGEPLFWELPELASFEPRGEPFVCALLPAAMRAGTGITLPSDLPLDPTFLTHIERLQAVFARWFPDLRTVPIRATVATRTVRSGLSATGYSGGIDSSFSLDVLGKQLDAALLIDGIEYRQDAPELFDRITSTLDAAVERRGLRLIRVRTNVKAFGRTHGAKWSEALGGAIASSVHAAGFAQYHVAASNSWENLRPYGSHPLTDPLWSSATIRIDHHGAELRRIDKIRYLGSVPDLLALIRVCFQGNDYNCGRCQKCVMTMAGFRALGLTSPALPHLSDPTVLRQVVVEHDGDLVDWEELIVPGLERRDPVLHRELSRLVRHYRWRRLAKSFDELATGGRFRGLIGRGKRLAVL
jgi:hypothetical protein